MFGETALESDVEAAPLVPVDELPTGAAELAVEELLADGVAFPIGAAELATVVVALPAGVASRPGAAALAEVA